MVGPVRRNLKFCCVVPWFSAVTTVRCFLHSPQVLTSYINSNVARSFRFLFSLFNILQLSIASSKMSVSFILDTIPGDKVTETVLEQAATLFSSAYGVWSPEAEQKMDKYCKAGKLIQSQYSSLFVIDAAKQASVSECRLNVYGSRSFVQVPTACLSVVWLATSLQGMPSPPVGSTRSARSAGLPSSAWITSIAARSLRLRYLLRCIHYRVFGDL